MQSIISIKQLVAQNPKSFFESESFELDMIISKSSFMASLFSSLIVAQMSTDGISLMLNFHLPFLCKEALSFIRDSKTRIHSKDTGCVIYSEVDSPFDRTAY